MLECSTLVTMMYGNDSHVVVPFAFDTWLECKRVYNIFHVGGPEFIRF